MAKSVVIIGAGIAGLTAATRLAQRGYDVTVLEKNPQVGGKVYEYRAAGFRWDIAPTLSAPKSALAALFADLDLDLADYLSLRPIDPQARYFFPDGSVFNACRDLPALAAEIDRIAPGDYQGVLRFLAAAARWQSSKASGVGSGWMGKRFDSLRSMHQVIARFVKSDQLQLALGSLAANVGGSPFALPAAHIALAHEALGGGSWYPQGGVYALATALDRLAREAGATIQVNCPVRSIEVKDDRARGVVLFDGRALKADAVLANVDAFSTLRYLLPEAELPAPLQHRLIRKRMSLSAFVIMLGVRGAFPQLAHQNILFSSDRQREYRDLLGRETMPADPTIWITVSSKTDPLNAPVNQENWLIKLEAPPLSEKFDWASQRQACRDSIFDILFQRHGLDLRDRIRVEQQLTPLDFQRMTGAWRGALFGPSPQARAAPPLVRSSQVGGLYFAGASTQAGGDQALGIHSGSRAAAAIANDLI